MNFDTRMALCLLEQLVNALRTNEPDTFKRWLCGGVQDLYVTSKPPLNRLSSS